MQDFLVWSYKNHRHMDLTQLKVNNMENLLWNLRTKRAVMV